MPRFSTLVGAVALVALSAGAAAAQDPTSMVGAENGARPLAGWTFTPTLVYAAGYDDNVMVRGKGDDIQADFVNLLGPRANLSFLGRRAQIKADYSGGFSFYRNLGSLNTYDQHGSFVARRMVSKHVGIYASESFSAAPTTQLLEIYGVPYVRTGSKVNDVRAGVDAQLTKRASITTGYDFEWVKFDQGTDVFNPSLLGGHSHGGSVGLKYQIDPLTSITADGNATFATMNGNVDNFNMLNATAGLERKLTDTFSAYASGGIAHLGATIFGPARTGPAWRFGLSKSFERTSVDASYSRSFVPAFGFGGTIQNEEFTAHVLRPLSRRISASAALSWRTNEPLVKTNLPLHSVWVQGSLGYALNQWLRVEGFFLGVHQTIDQPGGVLDRNQVGIQIVTAKPMRIR